MTTSITQARPLLTASELELFEVSRAAPIKALTARQLAGKEKRVRALRDKYRDLYRRQTVAARGKGGARAASGEANARTQRKAEIMQELLERFEARSALLAERETRGNAGPKRAAKTVSKAKPKSKSQTSGSETAAPGRGQKPAGGKASAPAASGKLKATPRKPSTGKQTAGAVADPQPAEAKPAPPARQTGKDPVARSSKAPSSRAPTAGGKARAPVLNAPLDMVAAARRVNPVKNSPSSVAIQGHVSSSVRRSQGKRDSR